MANRRMVSLKIIDSARYLKMPVSTQNLYFHMILRADDDGIVEAYNVMRMIGCTEDDIRILVSKGFVVVLNDDLVTYINDWTEHNLIRSDRKVDSIYKQLLIQIVPEVRLIESRERADKNVSIGRPEDNQVSVKGQHRIGKVKVSYDNNKETRHDKKSYHGYELVKLTEDEYRTLIKKYGEGQTKALLDKLESYKLAKGKTYKSDMGAIRQWVIDAIKPTEIKPDNDACPVCGSRLVNVCRTCGFAKGDNVEEKRKEWEATK